jgi:hypothetical protein
VVHFLEAVPQEGNGMMNRASLNYGFFLLGIALMAFSGARLGRSDVEFAAFATAILESAICSAGLQTKKRIDELEKKMSELEIARKMQA